ncbi:class I SAM-dependent methyltransferase [Loktanella agnita]|uniref:class I SAM-dependent methyltransferase n=1 Tax=Loktanella agnita TaxID=287097 RepID=UPI00398770A3
MTESGLQSQAELVAQVEALLRQGKNVYQPLYNYPHGQSIPPLRRCDDRCAAVHAALGPDITGKRLLDVGCSLGYNTLYFVDRGMVGHGIDILERNVALCRMMQCFTPGEVRFEQAALTHSLVDDIAPGTYDVAFFFSVLHHIIETHGLTHVQELMRTVLEKIPVIFVELALRSETPPPGYTWDAHLPENALTLFETCGASEITLIGHFPTHVGPVTRPLYRITVRADG